MTSPKEQGSAVEPMVWHAESSSHQTHAWVVAVHASQDVSAEQADPAAVGETVAVAVAVDVTDAVGADPHSPVAGLHCSPGSQHDRPEIWPPQHVWPWRQQYP